MTLCISYINKKGEHPHGFALSDSRLTVEGERKNENGIYLSQSNKEIKNTNDHGIKIYVINQPRFSKRDIVISIAGAVSFGLHTAIHLESTLKGIYEELNYEQTISLITDTISSFWQDAYDKEMGFLFMLFDDDKNIRLLQMQCFKKNPPQIEEVEEENGYVIAVMGTNEKQVRDKIFEEIKIVNWANNKILSFAPAEISCIRALKSAVNDHNNRYVGGNIQAACLRGDGEGKYLTVHFNGNYCFRGLSFGDKLDPLRFPLAYGPSWGMGSGIYDVDKAISEIIDQMPVES